MPTPTPMPMPMLVASRTFFGGMQIGEGLKKKKLRKSGAKVKRIGTGIILLSPKWARASKSSPDRAWGFYQNYYSQQQARVWTKSLRNYISLSLVLRPSKGLHYLRPGLVEAILPYKASKTSRPGPLTLSLILFRLQSDPNFSTQMVFGKKLKNNQKLFFRQKLCRWRETEATGQKIHSHFFPSKKFFSQVFKTISDFFILNSFMVLELHWRQKVRVRERERDVEVCWEWKRERGEKERAREKAVNEWTAPKLKIFMAASSTDLDKLLQYFSWKNGEEDPKATKIRESSMMDLSKSPE